jgi:phosphatidate phosphatase PAH1
MAGDAILTGSGIKVDKTTGKYVVSQYNPGDGTVTRSSALMDERVGSYWTPKLISPIKLTKSPAFSDNVLFILLEEPGS